MMRALVAILLLVPALVYAQPGRTPCKLGDIVIKSSKAGWSGSGRARSMSGVAVLTNKCAEPVGVQVKITGLDKAGAPLATFVLEPIEVRRW